MVVGRRRRVTRRRATTRRRPAMRRMRLGRRVPLVHRFKETVLHNQAISAASNSPGFGQLYFTATQITNWPSMQRMFDLYKITGVKIRIVPYFTESDTQNVNGSLDAGTLPTLMIATNRDPYIPAPTSYADVLNDDGVKIIQLRRPVTLYLKSPKPNIVTEAPAGGAPLDMPFQFGVGSKWQPWLTTGGNSQIIDQSGLAHYGFRYALSNPGPNSVSVNIFATYYVTMKEQD